jgi:hypothetical protein
VIEKQYKDLTHTHLRGMVNSVVFREGADPLEFLEAVANLEGGSEAMANYFSDKWAAGGLSPAPAPSTRSRKMARCCPRAI